MTGTVSQEKFFANIKNKISSISFFIGEFKAINICAKQAKVDAEILIVETVLMSTKNNKNVTVIIGEDVDLLVILTVRNPPNMDFFPRARKRQCGTEDLFLKNFLFLHTFYNCDGTSDILQKGNWAAMKLLEKHTESQAAIQISVKDVCL